MAKMLKRFLLPGALVFALNHAALAEPIPQWELDDLWSTGVDGCAQEYPDWSRRECADLWDCYVEAVEMTFDNDYAGFRRFIYELDNDSLSEENEDNMLLIEGYCWFGF